MCGILCVGIVYTRSEFLTTDFVVGKFNIQISNFVCRKFRRKMSDGAYTRPGSVDLHNDISADESPPPLPPKPRFRTSSADVKRDQDRLHTPSTLVRCSSGPSAPSAPRNAAQAFQESLRKQLSTASSEPSLLIRDLQSLSPPSLPPKQGRTQAKQVRI
ncbi:hypothetical protein AB205_0030430 [Aquarana catesbeiana]|uniref:Uncharacterized protein n=1 Tax=Aquarana catesbeiana TaxID=8400 RepID=A0A2G9SIR4_AQUCT|nr:hypothetical protein AB205_0030430 [Aquarana catesbeiana]